MGEAVLVNRKKFVSSLANELVEPFNELSPIIHANPHPRLPSFGRGHRGPFEEICGKGPLTMGETGQFRLFSPFFPCASRGDVLE